MRRVAAQPVMRAHFLPVGQAHSTLLEFSCGATLIDAGAQDAESVARLLSYLDQSFERRTDLNKTSDLIVITHNHSDHTQALREVAERSPRFKTIETIMPIQVSLDTPP
jgi:beta-lactamase superfamily II metal-dependent hydrolase